MEVTVIKRLNGVEIHPAHLEGEEEIPMRVIAKYNLEISELGIFEHKSLNLTPYLSDQQKTWLENALNQAQQVIDAL